MPFTVEDFHSLVRLLEQHPEWRAELRRLVLSEELLTLPQLVRELAEKVRELAEAQRRTEAQVAELAEAQRRHYEEFAAHRQEFLVYRSEADRRFAELAEAQRRTEERLEHLAEAQQRTERVLERLVVGVGDLKGRDLERSYRERAASYFQSPLRRVRLIDHQTLGHLLDDAVDDGRITLVERAEVLNCDVVVVGQRDGEEVYLVGEVSWKVDRRDVQRAAQRAALLQKALGVRAVGVAAGREATEGAWEEAASAGVQVLLDGEVHGG